MKRNEKRLFLPALLVWCALVLAVGCFAVVRYFVLRGTGETLRLLWEVLPAAVALLLFGVAMLVLYIGLRRSEREFNGCLSGLSGRVKEGTRGSAAAGCLAELGETLSAQEGELLGVLAEARTAAASAATERERLSNALRLCREETPETISFGGPRYGIGARTEYSAAVGASFAEAFVMDRRRVFFAVGDVWGSGFDAALFSVRVKGALREQICAGKTVAEALAAVNAGLCARNPGNYAATLFGAVFHFDSGELRYANAGHFPPILTGDTVGFLRVRAGAPLGVYEDAQFAEETFALAPGQGLFLYTDGLVNGRSGEESFGFDRLLAVLKALCGNALDADTVTNGAVLALREFCGGECDVSALMLNFPGGSQRMLRPDLSEANTLEIFLSEWLGEDPRKGSILPACREIFTAIVHHAGARAIRVGCEREEKHLVIRFTDDGEPFNPLQAEEGVDLYADGGVGAAIRRLGGEFFYRTKQDLNVLTVRFPLARS